MKTRIIGILGLAVVILAAVLFFLLQKPKEKGISLLTAIPVNSAVIIKANGLLPLFNSIIDNDYWHGIPDTTITLGFEKLKEKLDSLSENNSSLYGILNDSSVYASIHFDNENTGFVLYFQVKSNITADKIEKILGSFNFKNKLFYSVNSGILIISSNKQNLNSALQQLKNKINLLSDTSFVKVYNTTGKKVSANIFINFKEIPEFFARELNNTASSEFKKAFSIYGWGALDLTIDKKNIALHSFAKIAGNSPIWLKLLANEQPANNSFNFILPASTIIYGSYAFSDSYNYKLAFNNASKSNVRLSENVKKLRDLFGNKIDERILNIIGEGYALAVCNGKDGQFKPYCIIKTKNNIDAFDFVTSFKKKGKLKNLKSQSSIIDSSQYTSLFETLPAKNLPVVLFGNVFKCGSYNSICNYNDYLIFGNSADDLQDYIKEIRTGKTILSDTVYRFIATELLAGRSNITIHFNTSKFISYISEYLNKNGLKDTEGKLINYSKSSLFGLQLSGNGEYIYINSYLYSKAKDSSSTEQQWSVSLDTTLSMPPIYVNAKNKKDAFIFVQDKKNNVYLISNNGKILWKKSLDEQILGIPQIIDFYKNGKNQILFNISEKIYLLDKSGHSIKGFPVRLKQKATNGISVADFDNNLNYRYYLATKNKYILALTKDGRKVEGWKMPKFEGEVKASVLTFKLKGKDLIVFSDSLKNYFLNRKGESLMKPKQIFIRSNNVFYIDEKPAFSKLITTDTMGNIYNYYSDGHLEEERTRQFSSKHKFTFTDINGDGQNEYVFSDSSSIFIYNQDRKLISNFSLPCREISNFSIIKTGSKDMGFIIQSLELQCIWKTNMNGKILKGFPVHGNSPMKVISLSTNRLTYAIYTGRGNSLVSYIIQ